MIRNLVLGYAVAGALAWAPILVELIVDPGWATRGRLRFMLGIAALVIVAGFFWPIAYAVVYWSMAKERS